MTDRLVIQGSEAGRIIIRQPGAGEALASAAEARAYAEQAESAKDIAQGAAGQAVAASDAAIAAAAQAAGAVQVTPVEVPGATTPMTLPLRFSNPLDGRDLGVNADGTDVTAALVNLISVAATMGVPISLPEGQYTISDDMWLPTGTTIIGQGRGALFKQTTHGCGVFKIKTGSSRVTIKNVAAIYEGERTTISGNYWGYVGYQRMCVIWCEGSDCLFENISQNNFVNTICLRGPVVRIDGTPPQQSNPGNVMDWSIRASNNRIRNVSGYNSDFVITGNQQIAGSIDGLVANNITAKNATLPHAIYMRNNGVGEYYGWCEDFNISNCYAYNGHYSEAYKIHDFRGCSLSNMNAHGTAGNVLLSECEDVVVYLGQATDQTQAHTPDDEVADAVCALEFSNSHRCTMIGGTVRNREGQRCGGLKAHHTGSKNRLIGCDIALNLPAGTTTAMATGVRAQDETEVDVINCSFTRLDGVDNAPFVAVGTSTMRISMPIIKGTSKLITQAGSASVPSVVFSASQIEGYTGPSGNVSGTIGSLVNVDTGGYRAGTGTAVLIGASTPGTNTYTAAGQVLTWVRWADWVEVSFRVTLAAAVDSTGNARIGPLPFASATSGAIIWIADVYSDNVTIPAGAVLKAVSIDDGTEVQLQTWKEGVRSQLNCSDIASNGSIRFTLRYRTEDP